MTTIPLADEELAATYRSESGENLDAIEHDLLALESAGTLDDDRIRSLLRSAHTLKGNSAMMGYRDVAGAAHDFEDALERLREGQLSCTPAIISGLLESADAMRGLIGGLAGRKARATLRVDVSRLDRLLDLTGEIAIARDGEQLAQLHATLREEVMRLRMVPLAAALDAQHRTARDAAGQTGRQVRLIVEGGDVEVDTSIAEQMRDPLTHMVRNAVDHGIETPGDRVTGGKPATGTIILRAAQEAGAVVLTLSDDGRGLNRAKIAARAEALGVATNTALLSDQEVFALIMEPGFSTATEITAVSGRGVGMDVVRQRVEALRGSIEIASDPGRGTRFTIRLPLTVAIMSGFTVAVGAERYVLPLETVEECFDLAGAARADAAEGVLELRGTSLPWISLAGVLGDRAERARRAGVIVVRYNGRRLGLVVDGFHGDCQVVIKPLNGTLRQLPGIAGSTILADGRAAFILNIPQLVDTCFAR